MLQITFKYLQKFHRKIILQKIGFNLANCNQKSLLRAVNFIRVATGQGKCQYYFIEKLPCSHNGILTLLGLRFK